MRVTGTLDGNIVFYTDKGYNACRWFYEDTKKIINNRRCEYRIALMELEDDYLGEPYNEKVKAAWRMAYEEVPPCKVNLDDVGRIITIGQHIGNECLEEAVQRSYAKWYLE